MSVISTHSGLLKDTKKLSNIEMKIKNKQDEVLALTQAAQMAVGDQEKLYQMHQQNVKLEQEIKQLQMEYEALKGLVESDSKMQKESIKRAFSATV